MRKPKNVDDYLELVDQAMFEVGDLIASAEYESDSDTAFSSLLPELARIDAGLKALWEEIKAGNYVIGRGEDLPFMEVVAQHREARRHTARSRVGEHRNVRQLRLRHARQHRTGLAHLQQRQQPFLHARTAARREADQRQAIGQAVFGTAGEALADDRTH